MAHNLLPTAPQSPSSARLTPQRARAWAAAAGAGVAGTRLSSLDSSVMQDLLRFDRIGGPGPGLESLEVMAAALRHGRSLCAVLEYDSRQLLLTVFPNQKLVHCTLTADGWKRLPLASLKVERVEPARREPPTAQAGTSAHHFELEPVLWDLALNGSRSDLLPEIEGAVGYRISPAAELTALCQSDRGATLAAAVARLRRETSTLVDIQSWPGFSRERAQRLLNGLYLNAALMVSRTHPSAMRDKTRRERAT
jgi:hypothetical protein